MLSIKILQAMTDILVNINAVNGSCLNILKPVDTSFLSEFPMRKREKKRRRREKKTDNHYKNVL